jgi:hypothetical protein
MSTGFGRKIDLSKFGGGQSDEEDDLPLTTVRLPSSSLPPFALFLSSQLT